MTLLQDKLREAIHAKAGEVPPSAVPPLDLPGRRRFDLPRAQLTGWIAPVAAAAAVAAAVAATFAVVGSVHLAGPAPSAPAGAPAFPGRYVALTFTGDGQCCKPGKLISPVTDAEVRATLTGRVLQKIAPPKPYGTFVGVTAAADDATFVLAAQRLTSLPTDDLPATGFFLLKIVPDGRALLAALPIPALPDGTQLADMALSPDGKYLAVAVGGLLQDASLHLYNIATGAGREWRPAGIGTGQAVGIQGALSWTSDGRALAFIFCCVHSGSGVRVLSTAAPGSSLRADSRLAIRTPRKAVPSMSWIQARIAPDGTTIFGITYQSHGNSQRLVAYSARTGKVLRVLSDIHIFDPLDEKVQWSSPSGGKLIVTSAKRGTDPLGATFLTENAGMLTGQHYTPLPWSDRIFQAAW